MITLAQAAESGILAFGLLFFIIIMLLGVSYLVFGGYAVYDATRWPDGSFQNGEKGLWVALNIVGFFFAGLIIWILYFVIGRPTRQTREAIQAGVWQPPPKYSQYPPQGPYGQGYPPQGYGYDQSGGYPPQGQGYPPQGQGDPPQGQDQWPPQSPGQWPQG